MMARERTVCSVIAAGTISIASMAITIHPPCHEPGERRGLREDIGPILLWPQILLHDLFHHLFRHSARKDCIGSTRAARRAGRAEAATDSSRMAAAAPTSTKGSNAFT